MNTETPPIRPLFVLSLPRSGSTLLQRLLAAHPDVATTSESWLLLPHVAGTQIGLIQANYGQRLAVRGFEDFVSYLPAGRTDYDRELAKFFRRLYSHVAQGRPVFLDKTPRYHLIASKLPQLFPDARIIILWRHPLAVIASIMGQDKWNLYGARVDLYDGVDGLLELQRQGLDSVYAVNYERLIEDPPSVLRDILTHAELSACDELLDNFVQIHLAGHLGDKTGTQHYQHVSSEPILKWRTRLNNPLRKRWCQKYLNWLGDARLQEMGYNFHQLQSELRSVPMTTRRLPSDSARATYGVLYRALETGHLMRHLRSNKLWNRLNTSWYQIHG